MSETFKSMFELVSLNLSLPILGPSPKCFIRGKSRIFKRRRVLYYFGTNIIRHLQVCGVLVNGDIIPSGIWSVSAVSATKLQKWSTLTGNSGQSSQANVNFTCCQFKFSIISILTQFYISQLAKLFMLNAEINWSNFVKLILELSLRALTTLLDWSSWFFKLHRTVFWYKFSVYCKKAHIKLMHKAFEVFMAYGKQESDVVYLL